MPLNHEKSAKGRSKNIAELIRAGHSPAQAAAIAYKVNGEDENDIEADDEDLGEDMALELDDPAPARPGEVMALDRSMRHIDEDGHLHVDCNVSKAMVCPYMGAEIPRHAELGLNPGQVYMLYRDPKELENAAPTYTNKPLMAEHIGVSAANPHKYYVVGTASNFRFAHPYLKALVTVWDGEAIKDIDSEEKRELSAGYRYDADMTSGTSPEGVPYHGVMRNLRANHVALVKEGRCGPDVLVADAALLTKA